MAVKSHDLSSAITRVSTPAGLGPTRIIKGDLILRSFNIWGPLSQMRPHSQVLGIGIQTYFLGGQRSTLCPFYVPHLWLVTCTQDFYDFCTSLPDGRSHAEQTSRCMSVKGLMLCPASWTPLVLTALLSAAWHSPDQSSWVCLWRTQRRENVAFIPDDQEMRSCLFHLLNRWPRQRFLWNGDTVAESSQVVVACTSLPRFSLAANPTGITLAFGESCHKFVLILKWLCIMSSRSFSHMICFFNSKSICLVSISKGKRRAKSSISKLFTAYISSCLSS